MADIPALLTALEVFAGAPDKASIDRANTWLQDFQHSPDAWAACNLLLLSTNVPPSAKLFAAQTFRSKVTYDLYQVAPENLLPLRDSLLTAIETYHAGPRAVLVQLCLAIAGLALQLPAWENPVQTMIDSFGRNPATVPTLIEFLKVLPEELTSNTRIPLTDDEYRNMSSIILTKNAKVVLDLLSVYIQAPGVTLAVQSQVFACLRNWLVAGEINVTELAETALFQCAFEALASDDLFDSAVDVIYELIHETQEIEDNMSVIQLIVPKLIALKSQLTEQQDAPDKIRGYARIYAEAGETYRVLLLQHTETFFPIVEAIGECSAYSDLDIVPITFAFWMRLAQMIGKKTFVPPVFQKAYQTLMSVIINHLHFPSDGSALTPQEAEDFRSFRHVMGDTLKDCCFVLHTETCLMATHQMITLALSRGVDVSWQEIEAPLFAMRSMGAEVDVNDDNAVPKIMDLIPSLPDHPRVRYAALLIVSRYSEWINAHPAYIPVLLQYISAGFESPDSEVCAAAGQALKYLCQDSKQHLSDFLPTLHTFLSTTGSKLVQEDRRQVYEAIAYVISAQPFSRAAESLRSFSSDIMQAIHTVTTKPSATKEELEEVGNGLENLEIMLHVIRGFGDELPHACQGSCQEAWAIFDSFFHKYGLSYDLSERATRVVRHGISFFGNTALSVAPSVVARMSLAFDATTYPSFLWIAGKIVGRFGNEENEALKQSFVEIYERSTNQILTMLQHKPLGQMPDVLEDYIQMLIQLASLSPDIFFLSSAFPSAFSICVQALTVINTEVIFAALNLFRDILTHDWLDPGSSTSVPKYQLYAAAIQGVVAKEGLQFTALLVNGLVGDFPEDSTSPVVSIFRVLSYLWSSQLLAWLPPILEQLQATGITNLVKTEFLSSITNSINEAKFDKVKYSILELHRASRKARARRGAGI